MQGGSPGGAKVAKIDFFGSIFVNKYFFPYKFIEWVNLMSEIIFK